MTASLFINNLPDEQADPHFLLPGRSQPPNWIFTSKPPMPSSINPAKRPAGFARFALGFRHFFLAAGLFAIVLLGLWLTILQGKISTGPLAPSIWHGHE
ncbi:MAG: NnrS family protein, partial [Candidatus Nanopelagicales bacterium]